MQRGGSSADAWVQSIRPPAPASTRPRCCSPTITPATLAHRKRLVTSRAAENLFWLGRYTERAENTIRLARVTLECLQRRRPVLAAAAGVADRSWPCANTLVLPGVPSADPGAPGV